MEEEIQPKEENRIIYDSLTCYYCKKVHETEEANKKCCIDKLNRGKR